MDITISGTPIVPALTSDEYARVNIELSAFDGEIGTGQFPIPDNTSAGADPTGRQLMVEEGSALLIDGFIIDQDWQRGPFRVADEREYNYSIQDPNALLSGFRVIRSRPVETDYARVLAFASADGPTWDTTWVLNAATVTMPAKKYDSDGGWGDLIADVVEFTGKTLFLHDKAAGGRCLHYHLLTNGHACGLAISDVLADVDGVTTFGPIDPARQRTSIDLENDILGRDQAARTHNSVDATSVSVHDADGLQHQALIEFEAGSQADLDLKTAAYLASQKADRDTFTCAIGPVGGAALELIRVGDLMSITSGAMGLTASTQRIAHLALSVWNGLPGRWLVTLELGAPVRRRAHVPSGSKPVSKNDLLRTVGPFCIPGPQKDMFARTVSGSGGFSEFDGRQAWIVDPNYPGGSHNVTGSAFELISGTSVGANASDYIELPFTSIPLEFSARCSLSPGSGNGTSGQIWFGTALRDAVGALPSARIDILLDNTSLDLTFSARNDPDSGGSLATVNINSPGFAYGASFWVRMLVNEIGIQCAFSSGGEPTTYTDTDDFPFAPGPGIDPPAVPTLIQLMALPVSGHTTVFDVDEIKVYQSLPYFCDDPGTALPAYGAEYEEIIGTGDGSTTVFPLTYSYILGSLHAFADIVEEVYVSGDPAGKTVTYGSPPFDTETLRARYRIAT